MLNITAQMLEQYTIAPVRLTDVSDTINSDQERELANSIANRLQDTCNLKELNTSVSVDSAQCGNMIHPLIRITSNKQYGCIGLLINRSIATIVTMSYGRVTNLIRRKEELADQLNRLSQSYNRKENYASDLMSGGALYSAASLVGHAAGASARRKKEKNLIQELSMEYNRIQYDPSELSWERAWEEDVLYLIKSVLQIE